MRVLDVVVADQDPIIVNVVSALLQWVELISKRKPSPQDVVEIGAAVRHLRVTLEPFTAVGVSLNTPKMHRALDVLEVIRNYGAARFVSTDTYEMAHKALKRVVQRYVLCVLFLTPANIKSREVHSGAPWCDISAGFSLQLFVDPTTTTCTLI